MRSRGTGNPKSGEVKVEAAMGIVLLRPNRLPDADAASVERVVESLLAAREHVAERRSTVRAAREKVQRLERAVKELEAEMVLEIAFETGANGKPRFSNESLREAELTRRKARDPQYRDLEAALLNAKRELQEAEDGLADALDEFRAWQIVAKLRAAEMASLNEG